MDDAFPIEDIDDILPGMIEGRGRVYCHFGREPQFDAQLLGWMRRLRQLRGGGVVPKEFVALGHLLHDLRLFKSAAELKLMRAAAAVAAEAHLAGMRVARPGATNTRWRPNCSARCACAARWRRFPRSSPVARTPAPCITRPTARCSRRAICC